MSHIVRPARPAPATPLQLAPLAAGPATARVAQSPATDSFSSAGAVRVSATSSAFKAGPPDGKAFVQNAIDEIRTRVVNGEKCRVVFDIDDTLSDSRGRTLHILQEFDRKNGTSHFADLKLEDVAWDGYSTAIENGLPKSLAGQVQGFWRGRFFGGGLENNLPHQEIIALAKAAKEAGAEVRYLTGRTEDIREGTLAELKRYGLPDSDDGHLFMKPSGKGDTGEYKAKVFSEWAKDGVHTGFFLTESRRDVAAVQGATPEIPCVLIDAAKERGRHEVAPGTPVYPSLTSLFGEPSPWEARLGWSAVPSAA